MKTSALSLEQAPPLSIPASFFLTIPLGILIAGGILVSLGITPLLSPWLPQSLALTHIGTLGILTMGMMGALYQMTPVIAGSPVPFMRFAHIVHALLVVGVAAFIWRLLGGPVWAMSTAMTCFATLSFVFVSLLGLALLRTPAKNETVNGMRMAVVSLAVITLIGLFMARGYAGGFFLENRFFWVQIHLTLALLGWVGGLIMAVSWQVIPMFYLAPPVSQATMRWFFWSLLVGLVLPLATVVAVKELDGLAKPSHLAALAALPAAFVIWLAHPVLVLRAIARRKRKRTDVSLWFWKTGLTAALFLIPIVVVVFLSNEPRWQVLFAWVAIWGWAGMIMHGMLCRIVPFLVWFHRYSARVGLEPTPSMRSLLPEAKIKTSFILHSSSVGLGAVAIGSQADWLARLTGLLLLATAVSLGGTLVHVLKTR